jgi:hypothetical protein
MYYFVSIIMVTIDTKKEKGKTFYVPSKPQATTKTK